MPMKSQKQSLYFEVIFELDTIAAVPEDVFVAQDTHNGLVHPDKPSQANARIMCQCHSEDAFKSTPICIAVKVKAE